LEDKSVAVIDVNTDLVTARVQVGDQPSALSYDSLNDYVYCACRGSNEVYVIDSHRDNVVKHIGVGAEPFALAWNPFTLRTYVLDYLGSSVSILSDSLHPGVLQTMNDERRTMNRQATIVRGVLFLPRAENGDSPPERLRPTRRGTVPIFRAALLDISGKKAMDLGPGANDVSGLAPGVYFVRAVSCGLSAASCQKVVVTR
jgi:YVTN family beta-propeller protein